MDPSGGRDSRYNLNYSMSIGLNMSENADMYGNPNASLVRPLSGIGGGGGGGGGGQNMNRGGGLMGPNSQCGGGVGGINSNNNMTNHVGGGGGVVSGGARGVKRTSSDCYDDRQIGGSQLSSLDHHHSHNAGGGGGVVGGGGGGIITSDGQDESYTSLQNSSSKKSPPANGKKTKGRVKIKMEYIDNKLRRYTTFSKRKTGIMKKAYELSTLTGTQVMLLVASETGHVYTFATRKLQPMITSEAGKQLIQTCLNSPDPPSGTASGDQRMSATGFEETELSYNIADEDSKDDRSPMSSGESGDESSGIESPGPNSGCGGGGGGGGGGILNVGGNGITNNHMQMTSNDSIGNSISRQLIHQSATGVGGGGGTNNSSGGVSIGISSGSRSGIIGTNSVQVNDRGKTILTSSSTAATSHSTITTPTSKPFIYPIPLANFSQEVLLNLVQSGLQVHQEEDGGHQYISIPISMVPSGLSKVAIKDSTHHTNGRESPPKEVIIKKENIE